MPDNASKLKSGCILINGSGEIIYSSIPCNYETNRFLEEIDAFCRIRNEAFGAATYGIYKVVLKKIIYDKHVIYLIEFKDKDDNYDDMPELKVIINKTREKLYKLIAMADNHPNEEVLELSRKLDNLIHYYLVLEMSLNS